MDAVAESGGIPRVSTRFRVSVENEQADAGRDGQTCLERPNSNGNREKFIFPVQLTTSRIGHHTRLIHTLLKVLTIHAYLDLSVEGLENALQFR